MVNVYSTPEGLQLRSIGLGCEPPTTHATYMAAPTAFHGIGMGQVCACHGSDSTVIALSRDFIALPSRSWKWHGSLVSIH